MFFLNILEMIDTFISITLLYDIPYLQKLNKINMIILIKDQIINQRLND